MQLLQAADFYQIPELVDVAVSLIRKHLTAHNAVSTLRLAAALSDAANGPSGSAGVASVSNPMAADRLKLAVRQFMGENLDALVSVLANSDIPTSAMSLDDSQHSGNLDPFRRRKSAVGIEASKSAAATAAALDPNFVVPSSKSQRPKKSSRSNRSRNVASQPIRLLSPPPPLRGAFSPPHVVAQHKASQLAYDAQQAQMAADQAAAEAAHLAARRKSSSAAAAATPPTIDPTSSDSDADQDAKQSFSADEEEDPSIQIEGQPATSIKPEVDESTARAGTARRKRKAGGGGGGGRSGEASTAAATAKSRESKRPKH